MRKGICKPERLVPLLAERGMSPQGLARRTQIPLATVRGYLSGKRDAISTRNMLLIAQALEIPMPELVDALAEDVQNI